MKRINLSQLSRIKLEQKNLVISYQDKDVLTDFCQLIIKQHQIEEQESIEVLNPSDWENLLQEHQNYRLFPDPKAYLIYFDKASLNAKKLPRIDGNPDDFYILCTPIFKHPSLEKLIADNHLDWYGLYTPFNSDLWSYFQTELSKNGFSLSPTIRSWWAETTFNYIQIKQLIEKIGLQHPQPKILELSDIEEHLSQAQTQDIQALIDAWMNQQAPQISNALAKIKPTDLSLVIWIMQRNLIVLDALKTNAIPAQDIFQKHKIWPKQTASFIAFNKSLNQESIAQLLCLLHEIDKHFKNHQISFALQKLQYLLLYSASLKA